MTFASERTGPVRVGDLLVAALPELRERLLEETLRSDWSRLIGPDLGRRSRPGRLKAGVLEVTVDNSTWLQEMTLRSSELVARVRPRVPSLTALKLVLGALPAAATRRADDVRPVEREES